MMRETSKQRRTITMIRICYLTIRSGEGLLEETEIRIELLNASFSDDGAMIPPHSTQGESVA